MLNLKQSSDQSVDGGPPVLVLSLSEKQAALVVDQILESREVVISSLIRCLPEAYSNQGMKLWGFPIWIWLLVLTEVHCNEKTKMCR
ncbi:MAG: hypothetical protein HYW01_00335 [Deltaproteobacteria bacterium]|nr:hypothetical protein [Deltaproteobacteria bacterium]